MVIAACAFASTAYAAPVLTLEASRDQATVHRNDEYFSYSVKVKNTGPDPTTGPTTVTFALPTGLKLAAGGGGANPKAWACDVNASVCTNAGTFLAGEALPTLKLEVWVYPDVAPPVALSTFSANSPGAVEVTANDPLAFGPAVPFGLATFTAKAEDELGADYAVAGGHPFSATTTFAVNTRKNPANLNAQVEDLRDLFTELPPGFIGNPRAATRQCTVFEVREFFCPASAVVGGAALELEPGKAPSGTDITPIYKVVPADGYVAAFAFAPHGISKLTVVIRAKVRSNGDYGVTVAAPLPPRSPQLLRAEFITLCGFGAKVSAVSPGNRATYEGCKNPVADDANEVPFLTNPTRCDGAPPVTRTYIDSWTNLGAQTAEGFPDLTDPAWLGASAVAPAVTDCDALTEAWTDPATDPSFAFVSDGNQAAAPAAYSAQLRIPQEGLLSPSGRSAAHLKDTEVILPAGVVLNPSAAHGLGVCTEAEAGYLGNGFASPNPMHFSTLSAGCPDSSKIGTVKVETPLLDKVLHGNIYLAAQDLNPFGSRFATYLVIEDEETGIKVTLAGRVNPDKADGRITATFLNNPQVPLEALDVDFFGGSRASLTNPDVCGTYSTLARLTPWSAVDPDHPTAAETAVSESPLVINAAAEGAASCPASKAERPFNLGFQAGSMVPVAGTHSPFSLRVTRPSGSQEIDRIRVTTPPGFAATLKGTSVCPESAVASAAAPGKTGKLELESPSCPASSQVGTTTIGAGAGDPFYVKTGKVYLTGPYKSAPISLTFIVPAVAGPFDLGVQVVRTALEVNPKTAQVTAVSDAIPQILDGVPLNIRDIRVDLDRPGFGLNPTNCEAMSVSGQMFGASGAVANLSSPFQVGACAALGFKPALKLQLHGKTKRGAYQRVVATLTARPGDANISRAAVTFPHSAFLAQEHLDKICTRVQFAAKACPTGSIYGYATAISPLLEEPVQGPIYLRSNPEHELPDLVAALRGPDRLPIEVELQGRTDSKNGGIRNTFDIVPDVPVTKFSLQLKGGNHALIVNSRDLCKGTQRATVRFSAQNGKTHNFRPKVGNDCGKKGSKGNKKQR
jgi:hypothetical protein